VYLCKNHNATDTSNLLLVRCKVMLFDDRTIVKKTTVEGTVIITSDCCFLVIFRNS